MFKSGARGKRRAKGERTALRVHPLFVLFGVYFLVRGEIFLFFTYTAVALLHEFGHAAYASRIGCRLTRIVLLPCGAIARGDIEGISLSDEIRLALAGPAVNAACAAGFAALWWLFPDTYAYTDTAAIASAALAAVNLLPAYPLDGGRIAYCAAAKARGEKFARGLMAALGAAVCALLAALFVLSLFRTPNFTVLFFALFVAFGAFGVKDCRYTRIRFDISEGLWRGMEVKRVALRADATVKKVLSYMERGRYLEIMLFDADGTLVCEVSQSQLCDILAVADIYRPLSEYVCGAGACRG